MSRINEYYDQEHEIVIESTLIDLVPLIPRINDRSFYLKTYTLMYTIVVYRWVSKNNNSFISFSHLPSLMFFILLDTWVKLTGNIRKKRTNNISLYKTFSYIYVCILYSKIRRRVLSIFSGRKILPIYSYIQVFVTNWL